MMEGPTRLPKSPASSGETPKARAEECDLVLISVSEAGLTEARPGMGVHPGQLACRIVIVKTVAAGCHSNEPPEARYVGGAP